jgi:HlyD family secretion protein
MGRILKVFLVLVVLSGGGVAVYSWWQGRGTEEDPFTLIDVAKGEITEKAVAVGQIEPRMKFHVKSKISGIVRVASVEVGDTVQAGDPLLEIVPDPTPSELVEAERTVQTAEAAFKRAESDWTRTRQLSEQGVVSGDEVDADREAFERTGIELARARDNLLLIREGRIAGRGRQMESVIRAPAAGIVLERLVNPGDPVVPLTSFQEGTSLITIADMSDLIFRGTVDEIDVGKLYVGLPARLKIGALPDAVIEGALSRIAPQAIEEDNAKLFEVEIQIAPQSDVFLRAGYSANADLVIQERRDILIVPERLIRFEGEDEAMKAFVELPPDAPGAEPRKVEVETGLSDGLNIEVTSGLEEGDKVVQRPPRDVLG